MSEEQKPIHWDKEKYDAALNAFYAMSGNPRGVIKPPSPRLRRYRMPMREMLTVLRWGYHGVDCQWIDVPEVRGIPSGGVIKSVHFDWPSQCFDVVVEHPDFAPVEPGRDIPLADCFHLEHRAFRVIKSENPEEAPAVDLGQPLLEANQPRAMMVVDESVMSRDAFGKMKAFWTGSLLKLPLPLPLVHGGFEFYKSAGPNPQSLTDRARKALDLAKQEARRLNHEYLGAEHVLMGLVLEGGGVAFTVLRRLGMGDPDKVRAVLGEWVKPCPRPLTSDKFPMTPRVKKLMELANTESKGHGDKYVGTEHLLAAMTLDDETAGPVVKDAFMKFGHELRTVRKAVFTMLGWCTVEPTETTATKEARAAGECTCSSLLNGHEPGCPLANG